MNAPANACELFQALKQEWTAIPAQVIYNLIQSVPERCRAVIDFGMACWLERRTRDRKVASSNSGRSGGRIFFSRVNFVCRLLVDVRSTPVLPQWHVKDPDHSAKSAGCRLRLHTHTPLTQRSRGGLIILLSRHSVGTYQETSSHATRQGTLGHTRLRSLSYCGPILA